MAQLVKLSNYISRYEMDLHHYSRRYPRLKKERWQRMREYWETEQKRPLLSDYEEIVTSSYGVEGTSWKRFFRRFPLLHKWSGQSEAEDVEQAGRLNRPVSTIEALGRTFKEELYRFQLSWASSTISETSQISKEFLKDTLLARLVKDLPDTYLILYCPVVRIRNAEVEIGIIVVTPVEIWLLQALEGDEHTIYTPLDERYWSRRGRGREDKMVHPGIALRRMVSVIREILQEQDHPAVLKTAVLARNSFIDVTGKGQRMLTIDKRSYGTWFEQMKKNHSPIKPAQLQTVRLLLKYCETYAAARSVLSEERAENQERGFSV
ncbi:hypothetical protein CR205_00650 [Alteribacter lacisalsi]|uniref:NERD domain-containing protein n=1 Tax=Alteribacter lacisalsi TaxID=2045244 RepID=A0A2W0HI61_9BACI|nr:hypothetical protein [Alteribacter lacisalsi]PYZ97145.1 hypothetical protein CR205_00650 [Alteribacter lacisalsi]